jgi:hypothetical protein
MDRPHRGLLVKVIVTVIVKIKVKIDRSQETGQSFGAGLLLAAAGRLRNFILPRGAVRGRCTAGGKNRGPVHCPARSAGTKRRAAAAQECKSATGADAGCQTGPARPCAIRSSPGARGSVRHGIQPPHANVTQQEQTRYRRGPKPTMAGPP